MSNVVVEPWFYLDLHSAQQVGAPVSFYVSHRPLRRAHIVGPVLLAKHAERVKVALKKEKNLSRAYRINVRWHPPKE